MPVAVLSYRVVDAPVVKCAVCGGPAQAGDRSCRYCGAGIATLRCSFCFHANTVDAIHCAGCGAELGLALEGKRGHVDCPDCKSELLGFDSPAGTLFSCDRCGGQFVQHALLRSLLEQPVLIGHAAPGLTLAPANPFAETVRYRPCPVCESAMNRKNFGGSSGVILDVCPRHGSWFDPGELPRVLEFARQGGLERERLREQERARSAPGAPTVIERISQTHHRPALNTVEPADFVSEMLGFLAELVTLMR